MTWTVPEEYAYKEILSSSKLNTQVKDNLIDLNGRGSLGYAEITADVTTTTVGSDVDVAGMSIAVTVPTGGRRIKITVFAAGFYASATVGNVTVLNIKEGSTVLSFMRRDMEVANSPDVGIVLYSAAVSSGAHTYKVAFSQNQAGILRVQAGATSPAFILVELI